jgi:hypothetical protein
MMLYKVFATSEPTGNETHFASTGVLTILPNSARLVCASSKSHVLTLVLEGLGTRHLPHPD